MKTLGIPAAASALCLGAVLLTGPAAQADANLTPDYEVKLLLTTSVLDSSHNPSSALKSYLHLSSSVETRSYQYLDTDDQQLDAEGWSVRERRVDDKGSLQLNFKHRWAITSGNVGAALDEANDDGFDSSDDNYDAQVDWGYSNRP